MISLCLNDTVLCNKELFVELCGFRSFLLSLEIHSFLYIRTSNFLAEAEPEPNVPSFFFGNLNLKLY